MSKISHVGCCATVSSTLTILGLERTLRGGTPTVAVTLAGTTVRSSGARMGGGDGRLTKALAWAVTTCRDKAGASRAPTPTTTATTRPTRRSETTRAATPVRGRVAGPMTKAVTTGSSTGAQAGYHSTLGTCCVGTIASLSSTYFRTAVVPPFY